MTNRYWVYIITNKPRGVLYIGVTNNIERRDYEHKNDLIKGFSKRYRLHRLVYLEETDNINAALQREKNLKHWVRDWKIQLIENFNPEWQDLGQTDRSSGHAFGLPEDDNKKMVSYE